MILFLKFLAIPLYPLGLSLVLITAGLYMIISYRHKGVWLIAAGTILLYTVSTPFVSRLITRPLERPYFKPTDLPRDCSAIVLLGGGGAPMVSADAFPEVNDAGDRILHAARLYKTGISSRVITSGGRLVGTIRKTISEGKHNAILLSEIGVDSNSIIIENKSRVTADHPRYIAQILDSLKLSRRIILVTSAAHMKRSLAVFGKYGFTSYPAATDFQSGAFLFEDVRDFLPSAGALHNSTSTIHEYYGIIGYKLLGKS